MNTIDLSNPDLVVTKNGEIEFALLGDASVIQSDLLDPAILTKISTKNIDEAVPGFWGTLGMPDDSPLNFTGKLSVSKYGNDYSAGETLKLVKKLYDIHDLQGKEDKVIERFINFDDIAFEDFDLVVTKDEQSGEVEDNIPRLRLTIFLGKDEGAVAFYEYSKNSFTSGNEVSTELILPEIEPVNNRDRITYVFPILPKHQIVSDNDVLSFGVKHNKSFVIKVLTFKRDNSVLGELESLKHLVKNINAKLHFGSTAGLNPKYKLLKYNYSENSFFEVNPENAIDTNLKTLLLIHGTFVVTANSFSGFMIPREEYDNKTWLQKMIHEGRYGQVLAFDHPTVSEDAEQNANVLLTLLSNNGADFSAKPVDMITTSRGGLIAKYLIFISKSPLLPVNKVALIACANGSGYFITGKYISKLLGVFGAISAANPMSAIILGLAQYSANTFLKMPGCEQMTPRHPRLIKILNATANPLQVKVTFQTIVGDWDKTLVDGFFKRIAERGLDKIIQLMLGHENDWVIGTDNQKILPNEYMVKPIQVRSVHTSYLNVDDTIGNVHEHLDNFL